MHACLLFNWNEQTFIVFGNLELSTKYLDPELVAPRTPHIYVYTVAINIHI